MAVARKYRPETVRSFLYALLVLLSPALGALGFSPPWPQNASVITAGGLSVYLLFVFQFRSPSPAQRKGRLKNGLLILGAGLSLAGYLFLFERFTFELPTTSERVVVGCGFTSEARLVAGALLMNTQGECPGHFEDLLEKSQYDSHQIWTKKSLSLIKLSLAGLWSGFFVCLAVVVGDRIRILQARAIEPGALAVATAADVFISYSHEDRGRAQILVTALKRDGLSVWWDLDLPPGETWDRLIEQRLQTARSVVVLWTTISVTKVWVREEALDAQQRGVLVPVLLDDVAPPLGYRHLQAVPLIGWDGDASDAGYCQLLGALTLRRSGIGK
jgi:hypothetical protein